MHSTLFVWYNLTKTCESCNSDLFYFKTLCRPIAKGRKREHIFALRATGHSNKNNQEQVRVSL